MDCQHTFTLINFLIKMSQVPFITFNMKCTFIKQFFLLLAELIKNANVFERWKRVFCYNSAFSGPFKRRKSLHNKFKSSYMKLSLKYRKISGFWWPKRLFTLRPYEVYETVWKNLPFSFSRSLPFKTHQITWISIVETPM